MVEQVAKAVASKRIFYIQKLIKTFITDALFLSFKATNPQIIQHEPYYRLLIFLIGLSPPPNSAGSTVLNPLDLLLSLLLGLLTGLCSSITSTISSSGGSGRLVLRSSTIIVSLLVRLGLLTLSTSAVSVCETREWERERERECDLDRS